MAQEMPDRSMQTGEQFGYRDLAANNRLAACNADWDCTRNQLMEIIYWIWRQWCIVRRVALAGKDLIEIKKRYFYLLLKFLTRDAPKSRFQISGQDQHLLVLSSGKFLVLRTNMETISRLRSVLLNSLGSRGLQHGEQELFDELMVHKTRLLHVFDVGPRNTQEQRDIESGEYFVMFLAHMRCISNQLTWVLGKTVVNGRSIRVNADFARLTIFLSQQLDCSEQYMAGILYTIMAENPNISPVSCVENAIAEFHERRRHLADSLRFLFEAAEASRSTDSEMYQRLDTFVRTELVQPQHVQGGEISMAYRIFKEIEDLGEVITRAYTARQNAGSNTVAPGGQGSSSWSFKGNLKSITSFCMQPTLRLGMMS